MFRTVSRLLVALGLACGGLVLTGLPAQAACTCRPDASVRSYASDADVVFRGVLTEQQDARRRSTYTLDVERVYKGRVDRSPLDIVSAGEGSRCGLGRLRTDLAYIVFATGRTAQLESAQCTGTGRATPGYTKDVERVLGRGQPFEPPAEEEPPQADPVFTRVDDSEPPELTRVVAPGAALVIVGLLGLVVFRRRA